MQTVHTECARRALWRRLFSLDKWTDHTKGSNRRNQTTSFTPNTTDGDFPHTALFTPVSNYLPEKNPENWIITSEVLKQERRCLPYQSSAKATEKFRCTGCVCVQLRPSIQPFIQNDCFSSLCPDCNNIFALHLDEVCDLGAQSKREAINFLLAFFPQRKIICTSQVAITRNSSSPRSQCQFARHRNSLVMWWLDSEVLNVFAIWWTFLMLQMQNAMSVMQKMK